MTDALEQLLRSADAANPPPPGRRDLAGTVQRRRSRRRRARVAAASLTMVALAFAVALTIFRQPPEPAPLAAAPVMMPPQLTPETMAQIHELTVQAVEARQIERRASERRAPVAAAPSPRELRDRAALILIYDADQHLRARRRDDAVARYQRTIELFPQSPWADLARQRLKQIQA